MINKTAFNANTVQLQSGQFNGLQVSDYPLLILNGFEYSEIGNWYSIPMSADVDKAKLTEDDISALIKYVGSGGSILIMESIAVNTCDSGYGLWNCKLSQWNPEPIGRLLDSAGLAVGHPDTVVLNGNGPRSDRIWGANIRPRSIHSKGIWLIEKYTPFEDKYGNFPDVEEPIPSYKIHDNGTVTWEYLERNLDPGIYKPSLGVASWKIENKDSAEDWQITQEKYNDNTTVYAFVEDRGQADLETQKQTILNHPDFLKSDETSAYKECDNNTYHYEINCLEFRPTNGVEVWGDYNVPKYSELALSEEVAKAMIKAGDLGTNIQRLYQHELYFRTKGKKGTRLSGVDVHRIYKNMTVWLWNTLQFSYDSSKEDELGFKVFTEFLNCYSNDQHGGNTTCPTSLKKELQDNNMIYGSGDYENMMNPSYPVHFKEKPLTRLMLGRSYWDLNIKVDLRVYPGEPSSKTGGGGSFTLNFSGTGVGAGTGNLQSTGQWAVAHQAFTVSTNTTQPVTIIIGLNDDLTGLEKHEKRMQRPPRISK
ncbi:MAG: Accessory colonization factor AcfD, partial [Deltaproteobacteria bacterium]|nr:Accessory colonization factor AcfD [Deltaproteobacteria bacterium]